MFILLHGPDTFRSRKQLKEMIREFQAKRDPSGINTVIFDAEKAESSDILEAMVASPFLAERRMVVIERLSEEGDKDFLDTLLEMAKDKKIPESTNVIFWEEELPAKKLHLFFEFLKKQKYSQFFDVLKRDKLGAWIEQELLGAGIKIEPRALGYLLENPAAEDLWQFHGELDKLIAYAGSREDKTINAKDVQLMMPAVVDDEMFHFVDALLSKNSKGAIKLLHDQWSAGKDEAEVFGALVWQFRTLLVIKDFLSLNPGLPSAMAASKLGLHPFVVKKAMGILGGFSFERLKELYGRLLEIDIKTKTGEGEQRMLLDLFVAEVCKSLVQSF